MSSIEPIEYNSRLREITAVLRKHNITRGVTPKKLRMIIEDLGPTFIKLGQIMSMHSDILPKRYCDELMKLRSDQNFMKMLSGAAGGSAFAPTEYLQMATAAITICPIILLYPFLQKYIVKGLVIGSVKG